jgi:hypothetical protein
VQSGVVQRYSHLGNLRIVRGVFLCSSMFSVRQQHLRGSSAVSRSGVASAPRFFGRPTRALREERQTPGWSSTARTSPSSDALEHHC